MSNEKNSNHISNNATGKSLKFALAQSHFMVGDIQTNIEKMRSLAIEARDNGANIIIFPELALLGYPPRRFITASQSFRQSKSSA